MTIFRNDPKPLRWSGDWDVIILSYAPDYASPMVDIQDLAQYIMSPDNDLRRMPLANECDDNPILAARFFICQYACDARMGDSEALWSWIWYVPEVRQAATLLGYGDPRTNSNTLSWLLWIADTGREIAQRTYLG